MNDGKLKGLINNMTDILGKEHVVYDPASLDIYS